MVAMEVFSVESPEGIFKEERVPDLGSGCREVRGPGPEPISGRRLQEPIGGDSVLCRLRNEAPSLGCCFVPLLSWTEITPVTAPLVRFIHAWLGVGNSSSVFFSCHELFTHPTESSGPLNVQMCLPGKIPQALVG